MPSLPPVSQKVIADVEQYLAEWKRMERQTQSSAGRIDREVGDLTKKLAKKFELADVGKDILKGAGLFGGFAIAEKAAGLMVAHFEEAAKFAQEIADLSQKSLDSLNAQFKAKRTDEQNLTQLLKDQAAQQKIINDLYENRRKQAARAGRHVDMSVLPDAELKKAEEAKAEAQRLQVEIDALRKKIAETKKADATKADAKEDKARSEQLRKQEKETADLISTLSSYDAVTSASRAETVKFIESIKETADPTLKFRNEIAKINEALELNPELADAAAKAIDNVKRAMAKDEERRVDEALNDFFGEMDAHAKMFGGLSDAAKDLDFAFQSAFENAIIDGQKLSDVLRGLEADIARIWLRKNVTNSIAGWLGTSVIGKFLGFAGGGDPPVGVASMVGEEGPELFVPKTAGTIIPAGRTAAMMSGGGGGGTFFIDARGADRQGMARLEAMIMAVNGSVEQRAVGAVLQKKFRSSGFRRALTG